MIKFVIPFRNLAKFLKTQCIIVIIYTHCQDSLLLCRSKENLTIHHRLPRVRGGKTVPENCVTWCEDCHRLYHKKYGNRMSDNYGQPIDDYVPREKQSWRR